MHVDRWRGGDADNAVRVPILPYDDGCVSHRRAASRRRCENVRARDLITHGRPAGPNSISAHLR
jgi:hypothetical protein